MRALLGDGLVRRLRWAVFRARVAMSWRSYIFMYSASRTHRTLPLLLGVSLLPRSCPWPFTSIEDSKTLGLVLALVASTSWTTWVPRCCSFLKRLGGNYAPTLSAQSRS